jgi:DNA-binding IclR family transcriptional regulator
VSNSRGVVQSVVRASTLLRVLAGQRGYMPLGAIAAAAGLPKSTTHGLLQTLVSERFVEHDAERGRYRLSADLTLVDRRRTIPACRAPTPSSL